MRARHLGTMVLCLMVPREDGADEEALLQWNHSGLNQLRACALQAGAGEIVMASFDTAISKVLERLHGMPLAKAADQVVEQVMRVGEGGGGEGEEGLSVSQVSRLRELTVASLLMRKLDDVRHTPPHEPLDTPASRHTPPHDPLDTPASRHAPCWCEASRIGTREGPSTPSVTTVHRSNEPVLGASIALSPSRRPLRPPSMPPDSLHAHPPQINARLGFCCGSGASSSLAVLVSHSFMGTLHLIDHMMSKPAPFGAPGARATALCIDPTSAQRMSVSEGVQLELTLLGVLGSDGMQPGHTNYHLAVFNSYSEPQLSPCGLLSFFSFDDASFCPLQ